MSNISIGIKNLLGNSLFKKLKKILLIVITVYILVCLIGFFFQEKFIFQTQKLSDEEIKSVSAVVDSVEDIELKMKDGNILRGWFVKNSKSEKSNLLIYFGANAEEASRLIPKVKRFENWSIALINYRGYGMSEGSPGEKVLFSDSLEIYDYFANRNDINNSNIVVMGRSIGTGVATYLAGKRNTSAVILTSPYDSLTSVVQKLCPILPVNLILKNKFDSINIAPSVKSPALFIVGSEDKLIPEWHSRKLEKAWGGKVFFEEIVGEGHNSIDDGDEYWNKISEFLTKQEALIQN